MRALLIAVLVGVVLPVRAENPRPGGPPKPKAGPAAPVAPAKQPVELTIPGLTIARTKGGFLGLVLENSNFKLSFYNDKKEPLPVDVTRATARWPVHYSVYDERAVLTPTADKLALASAKFVRPPYQFKLYLTLLAEGSDTAPESYVIDFHQ